MGKVIEVLSVDEQLEKARTRGAKDIKKRKRREGRKWFKIGKTEEGLTRYGPAPIKAWFGTKKSITDIQDEVIEKARTRGAKDVKKRKRKKSKGNIEGVLPSRKEKKRIRKPGPPFGSSELKPGSPRYAEIVAGMKSHGFFRSPYFFRSIQDLQDEVIEKARVKAHIRTRKGKLERVQEYTRKDFGWKRGGKYGSHSVVFRFPDENRGEKFFDTKFSVVSGGPGKIVIGSTIEGGKYAKGADKTGIKEALKPGTILTLNPSWVSPRGEKYIKPIKVKIDSVEESEYNSFTIKYTEIKDSTGVKEPKENLITKKYPDSSTGAIQSLKEQSDFNTEGATAIPDPSVEGVWMVTMPKEKNSEGKALRAIVYLAGYKEPFGSIRKHNDFESED